MKPFWMVLGAGTPSYRHQTVESAKTEAERLAALHPGQVFVVLEAIASVKKHEFSWDCVEDGTVPF